MLNCHIYIRLVISCEPSQSLHAYPNLLEEEKNMARSNYLYLVIVLVSTGTVGAFILPLGSMTCPHSTCRSAVSEKWDFSIAPERQLMTFASPEGLAALPTH